MNLEESDVFKEELEKNNRNKRNVLISIIFCGILMILLIVLIRIIVYQDSITQKFYIDDRQISVSNTFYIEKDGQIYLNVKELGTILGYSYTKGVYGAYNEDNDSCYLANNVEILALSAGTNKYTKHIGVVGVPAVDNIPVRTKNPNGYSESFTAEHPIIYENDIIYIPATEVMNMLNMRISWSDYRIRMYSLIYAKKQAEQVVAKVGLAEMSGTYENLRAINYGYIIVGDSTTPGQPSTSYGVISTDGVELISKKYDEITFIQNTNEFYITAANGTVGLFDSKGETIIAPSSYEEIKLLDQANKLYIVRKGREYGVLNGTGKTLVYAENDKVGIDVTPFKFETVENNALFFGKCIPVEKDGKLGLYNLEGEMVLASAYDGFGYISRTGSGLSGSEQSALLIPSYVGINGIIVNYNDKYGIYDVNVGLTVPTVFDKIYSITKGGETTYYAEYNGEQMDLATYLRSENLNTVDSTGRLLSELQATDVTETENEVETETTEEVVEGQSEDVEQEPAA